MTGNGQRATGIMFALDATTGLRCLICGRGYGLDEADYLCPLHGADGILDVEYDYDRIRAEFSKEAARRGKGMWRFHPLLPVGTGAVVPPLLVGDTPLVSAPRLAERVGVARVWVKDEGRQPTGSLKDRASAMAVARADESGAHVITTASTGNAAAALAGMCAASAVPAVIFVPEAAPEAKVAQLLAYGAVVILVEGSYADAFALSQHAAATRGWYDRNTCFNPYMTEGKKTVVYEICESLHWEAPDVIVVGVGDGCIIGSLHKGLRDLMALGWIDRMPRLIGVQASGSAYLAEAWALGEDVLSKAPIAASTLADSISADLPRDRLKAMAAVVETDGAFVTVVDDSILQAIPVMARGSGVFGEPAAAASYAGLEKAAALGLVGDDDRVVIISTGTGLKDPAAAVDAASRVGSVARRVAPTIEALERVLDDGVPALGGERR
jgi:threonine synthase